MGIANSRLSNQEKKVQTTTLQDRSMMSNYLASIYAVLCYSTIVGIMVQHISVRGLLLRPT